VARPCGLRCARDECSLPPLTEIPPGEGERLWGRARVSPAGRLLALPRWPVPPSRAGVLAEEPCLAGQSCPQRHRTPARHTTGAVAAVHGRRTLRRRAGRRLSSRGDLCRAKCPAFRKATPKGGLSPRRSDAADELSRSHLCLCSAPSLAPCPCPALGLFFIFSPQRHMESWISFLSSFN